jgi:hypothetical protein
MSDPGFDIVRDLHFIGRLGDPETNGVGQTTDLEMVVGVFRRWLHLPDPSPLLAALGAVAANRLDGDPVWLLLVGPPGGGKSELLGPLTTLHDVHPTATLTEAALLSGTPKREKADDAKGGLLREIGDYGILLAKDFGSILNMNRDARAQVLAALREIYDGSWTRHVGTDGGRTLHWSGKVGLIAGCTPTIDRHHAVMGSMGERFCLFRLPDVDGTDHARRALEHAGREAEMRAELAAAVDRLFLRGLPEPRRLEERETAALLSFSTFAVRARSAVERDGYTRDIELIPQSEAPTRLIVVLARLLAGLDSIGTPRDVAWRIVAKVALDSIPAIRLAVLDILAKADKTTTRTVAETLGYPSATARRALEDLMAHGLVRCCKQGEGKADLWTLDPWARQRIDTFPEKSSSTRSGRVIGDSDISGNPAEATTGAELQWREEHNNCLSSKRGWPGR